MNFAIIDPSQIPNRLSRVAIVRPNQLHQLDGRGDWQAVIRLDPESQPTRRILSKYLQDRGMVAIDVTFPEKIYNRLGGCFRKALLPGSSRICDRVIATLTNTNLSPP